VAAAVAAGVGPAGAQPLRGACEPLDYGYTEAEAVPRGDEVVVPVVLHLMAADVPSHNPRWPNHPLDVWDPRTVHAFFGRGGEPGRVNRQVWQAAGVRVAVIRVERCVWSPVKLRPDGRAVVSAPIPEEGPAGREFFRRVADAYNAYDARTVRALDVYLWVKAGSEQFTTASAYGTSLRSPPAAVWADRLCALRDDPATPSPESVMAPETCARKLAHEIGHALALPHTCRRGDVAAGHPDAALPLACDEEPAAQRTNLMRARGQGDRLTPAQVACAADWARRHYGRAALVPPGERPAGCLP
jgi:hypothetical protein